MMTLLQLCGEFFMTGLLAVGGGLATLPFLSQMSVRHPAWFSQQMLANMVAVSESTPGPIGINMATYVGYTVAGIPGSVLATLSIITPSIIVILIIARALDRYQNSGLVKNVFSVLRSVVVGLIAAAAFSLLKMVLVGDEGFRWLNLALLVIFFALTQIKFTKNLHPILFIAAGALVGILLKLQ